MSAFNDIDIQPTGVQGVYAGVQNTSQSSTGNKDDVFATGGTLSGHAGVPSETGYEHHIDPSKKVHDVIEAEPGLIETTDLAPLGHEVIVPDDELQGSSTRQSARTAKSA